MTPELIDGRFRVLRTLGEGASASVFLVDDLLRGGRRLALKQLAAETPRELLAAEFEALSALSHPGLVALHDLELGGERPYLTVEYVEGPPLLAWAQGHAQVEVIRALYTLLEALALLHDRGWVHGDLKPDNVLCDAATDQPKLCDLGLARRGGGLRGGTAGYAAPEVLLGGGTSAAADVYAFGVLCLEALAGRRAFGEDAATAVERQARGESILREPSAIPQPLAELLGRCLERKPERRPANAGELLLLFAGLAGLGPRRTSLLPEPSLRGRARELEAIGRAIERAANGEPGAILVTGDPGLGKTRLLSEARRLALRHGLAAPIAGDLREALAALCVAAGGAGALEPALAVALAGLLPSLAGPRAAAAAGLETRLRAALPGLATAACARRPQLLVLDDVDRLEPVEQAALLGLCRFLSEAGTGRPRLLLLLAAREPGALLAELERLELKPLDLAESEALLRSMLPPTFEAPLEELAGLAAGSPFLLGESLRAWFQRAGPASEEGPSADPLAALARERLAGLPEAVRQALRVAALAPELDARVLLRLCPLEPAELPSLLARRLLRERTSAGRVMLGIGGEHLRAILACELDANAQRSLHRELASSLDALPAPPEDAAWHWERAGELRTAAERYLAAAEQGFDYRGRFAARAAELGTPGWPRFAEAARRAARSLAGAGEAAEALRSLEALRGVGIASDEDRTLAGELLILLGEPGRALELLDPLPAGAGLLAAQACILLDRRAEAATLCASLPESGGRSNLLGLLALAEGSLDRAATCFADAEARFRDERDFLGLAKAENNLAIVAGRHGDLPTARACFARAIEHAREAGDPVRAIHGQINRGTVCQLAGELASAIRDYQQAVLEAGRLGSLRLEAQARLNLATLRIELGDPAGAEQELSRIRSDEAGLEVFVRANRADLALLRQDLGLAERELCAAEALCPPADPTARVELALVRARLLRARGEHAAAAALASRASEEAARAGQGRLADEARLAASLALRRTPDASADELRRSLEGIALRMEARGERGRLWLVHHELALAESLSGRELESGFHLAKARQAAEALLEELPEPLRRTLLTRPEFREVYAATRPLGRAPAAPEPAATLDLDDAEGLLRIGLELGRVRDPAELVSRVLDKAIEITDAQRGLLILVEGDRLRIAASRNLDPQSLTDDTQFSTQLAHDVIGSGRAVVTVDASADDRFRHFASVSNLQLRSVLCVPLKIWGTIAGVIYLDNRFRPGVFSAHRIAVLESLGAQAGLALDTARLLEEERRRVAALAEAKREVEALSEELRHTIDRQSRELGEKEELVRAQERQLAGLAQFDEIVGRSPPLRRVLEQIAKTASAEIPIYIFGESGTGKELIARAVHRASPRHERPMITVNCGGLPPALLQSELFGHLRGAFTGAVRDHPGLFRMADRGTIFLDEVTEMSPDLQVQLLRVLQTGTFRPVGGEREVQVDVRVISASNVDLDDAVGRGAFREDLSYRLNVLRLDLPSLRQRREDIPLLVRHFLGERAIDRSALLLLQHYDWPGNVRELANELARASALAEGPIGVADLSPKLTPGGRLEALGSEGSLEQRVAGFERELLREALAEEVAIGEVARRLGLSRAGLYKKLARHGLPTRKRS